MRVLCLAQSAALERVQVFTSCQRVLPWPAIVRGSDTGCPIWGQRLRLTFGTLIATFPVLLAFTLMEAVPSALSGERVGRRCSAATTMDGPTCPKPNGRPSRRLSRRRSFSPEGLCPLSARRARWSRPAGSSLEKRHNLPPPVRWTAKFIGYVKLFPGPDAENATEGAELAGLPMAGHPPDLDHHRRHPDPRWSPHVPQGGKGPEQREDSAG